jgi:hypothetical protein
VSLYPSDLDAIDRLAAHMAKHGKRLAWRAYTTHAVAEGWGNTPAWVAGREAFTALWRRYRAAYAPHTPSRDNHP